MPGTKGNAAQKANPLTKQLVDLEKEIKKEIELFRQARGGTHCYPLLLNTANIGPKLVDDTYEELQSRP